MNQVIDFFSKLLFYTSGWPVRWYYDTWSNFYGWLYFMSDLLIGATYFAIPVLIIKYILRKHGVHSGRIYFLFAAFILTCGSAHFLDAVSFWYPAYRLDALFRFVTAIISSITVFCLVKYLPFLNKEKKLHQYLAIRTDIAERKKLEQEQAMFALIVNSSDDAILSKNLNSIITSWNKGAERIFGYTSEEMIGKPITTIIPLALRNEEKEILSKIKKGEIIDHYQTQRTKKSGEMIEVSLTVSPIRDPAGNIIGASKILRDITAQRIAEQKHDKLFKELSDYKFALDEAAIVSIADNNTVIKYVNDKFCKTLQYSKEELIGKNLQNINRKFHTEAYIDNLVQTISKGNVWKGELENRAKDGTPFWFQATIVPFISDNGKPYQYLTIRTDITDRKLTEEKLKKSLHDVSAYQQALNESSIVGITDAKGIITYANDNFCKISKYSRQELIGKDHMIVNSGFHSKELMRKLWQTITSGKIWRGELKNIAKDGTFFWVDTTIVPFLNSEGTPYQYVAIRSDISERKLAEKRLIISLKETIDYKYALDEAAIVTIVDATGKVTYINDNYCRISKYSREDMIGAYTYILNKGVNSEELIQQITETIQSGKVWKGELKYRAKDDTYYWVFASIIPFLDHEGKPYQYLTIRTDITERKLAEERLNQSLKETQDYKYALDETAMVVIVDKNKRIMYGNEIFCNTYKYTQEELIGKSFSDFNARFNPKETILELIKTVDSGQIWRGELKGVDKDGGVHWFDSTTVPFLDEKGKPYQFLVIRIEITERKLAEEKITALYQELTGSEKRFRALIEYSKDVFIISSELGVTFVSPSVEPVLGFTEEEYKSKIPDEIIHPDDQPLRWDELSAPGDIIHLEFRTIHKNGSWRWMEGTGMNLSDVEGIRGHVFTVRDITERKEWEQRLLESEKIYKTIVSSIPGSFTNILDRDYRYLLLEGDLIKAIGYDKKDLIGRKLFDVVHPNDYEGILPDLEKAFEGEVSEREINSGSLDMVYKFVPFKVVGNRVEEAMIVGIDVSELKHTQRELADLNLMLEEKVRDRTAELEISNQELEAFSYTVSHDLRAPLRAVSGYSKIIEEDYYSCFDDDGKRLLGNIQKNAIQMGILIDDLLSFSRLGKKDIRKSYIDMNGLVKNVIEEVRSGSHYKASVEVENLLTAYADGSLMKQVWTNFISNAFKYSSKKEKPEIKIFSYREGDQIVYVIQDNGSGFDMQYNNKLFGIFERLHTELEYDGTGVGLAIVKRIIEKHEGNVWANAKLGEGATFHFSIPAMKHS